jgi:hypothetical protein
MKTNPGFKECKEAMSGGEPASEATLPASQTSPPTQPDGVTQAKKHLVRSGNLLNLCIACVDKVVAPKVPAIAQTPEFFQAAVMTLFIEASRMRFVEKMPNKPMKFEEPPRHTKD